MQVNQSPTPIHLFDRKFVLRELSVFGSQFAIFLLVAVLQSNFLGNRDQLLEYAKTKLYSGAAIETVIVITAIIFLFGLFGFLSSSLGIPWLERMVDHIADEAPRTIYFFGSSTSATVAAIGMFIWGHPEGTQGLADVLTFVSTAIILALIAFAYGLGISYLVRRRELACVVDRNKNGSLRRRSKA